VNMAFGDIVKVTPSSKVVGDLAIYLVSHDMTVQDLENAPPDSNLAVPNSVVDMFMGSLGEPEGGWPEKIKQVILRGKQPIQGRPGEALPPVDFEKTGATMKEETGSESATDLMSYLMYPEVFRKFAKSRETWGDLDVLPTPQFFFGLQEGEEISVELEPGKTLFIRMLTVGEARPDGYRPVFFELNGQPREVEIRDKSLEAVAGVRAKADSSKPGEVGAPIPGAVTVLYVKTGQHVKKGERLLVMEAMKMQSTVYAPIEGTVKTLAVGAHDNVEARDLLLTIE
jgi:pyruvate carboxylase